MVNALAVRSSRRRLLSVPLLAALLGHPPSAGARPVASLQEEGPAAETEVARLRVELEALRSEYAARLAALETRLATLEAEPRAEAAAPTTAAAAVPAGAAGAGGPAGALPVYGGVAASSKVFNPDIALIGNFLAVAGDNAVSPSEPFSLKEAEATFQAVVDPYARADFFLAYSEEGVEIEEGFVTFPTLPGGLLAKAGKLRASFGKVNALHTHSLSWADRPLLTQNLLGGEEGLADMGVSVSRLIPNPWLFLEATGEVFRGESVGVFDAQKRSDLSFGARLRSYADLTDAANLELGGSYAWGNNDAGPGFKTQLIGADASFRWRPLRGASYHRFLGRTELVWSQRDQQEGRAAAFGAYVSGEYQFARRWFGGLRLDYAERPDAPQLGDKGLSALITFWPSEFSQVRGQYRLSRYDEGETAHEVLFQLLFSIGAHGAHPF